MAAAFGWGTLAAAFGWGTLAASSLVIGAIVALPVAFTIHTLD